jgi:hypothetical protein
MVDARTPTTDLVASAYLRHVLGLTDAELGTGLPTDQTTWAETGFITVDAIGGTPHPELPQRAPVVAIETWAIKGKWNLAFDLAERVTDYFEGRVDSIAFDVKTNYHRARVLEGRVLTEPRKVRADPSLFAHVTLDLLLHWVKEPVS